MLKILIFFGLNYFSFYWCTFFARTDSYFSPYLLVYIVGMYCLFSKYFIEYTVTKKSKRIILFFATILSMMVVLANYKCLSNFTGEHFVIIKMVVEWSILLLGGGILFNEILATVSYRSFYMKKTRINRKIFLLAYGLIVTTNVIILLGTYILVFCHQTVFHK